MIDRQIIRALVDLTIFLEFSDDEVIDPDAAVAATEQLAGAMQMAGIEARVAFVAGVREIAHEYGAQRRFVEALPEFLGIETNDDKS
ncbi:hypothetical protein U1839_08860 [Sphingomonas sp. RT2P30]|uniref:hypothetical protein n=1 Tax=Parasphingomonas halimpatiens TaxID=3096162 RepID=UPI002FC9E0BB